MPMPRPVTDTLARRALPSNAGEVDICIHELRPLAPRHAEHAIVGLHNRNVLPPIQSQHLRHLPQKTAARILKGHWHFKAAALSEDGHRESGQGVARSHELLSVWRHVLHPWAAGWLRRSAQRKGPAPKLLRPRKTGAWRAQPDAGDEPAADPPEQLPADARPHEIVRGTPSDVPLKNGEAVLARLCPEPPRKLPTAREELEADRAVSPHVRREPAERIPPIRRPAPVAALRAAGGRRLSNSVTRPPFS